MITLFEIDKAQIRLNRQTNTLELEWKKFHDNDTYKLVYGKGLELIKEYGVKAWLSDIRNQGVVGPANAKWMQNEVIPKAFSLGIKKIAVVLQADIFKEFYLMNIEKSIGEKANDSLRNFGSVESANKWILEKQL